MASEDKWNKWMTEKTRLKEDGRGTVPVGEGTMLSGEREGSVRDPRDRDRVRVI